MLQKIRMVIAVILFIAVGDKVFGNKPTITYPIIICHDTIVNFNSQLPDLWFAFSITPNYSGNVIKCDLPVINTYAIIIWGTFSSLPSITTLNIGNSCFQNNTANYSTTISFPLNPCLNTGGYVVFHITPNSYAGNVTIHNLISPNPCNPAPVELPCINCLPSFAPEPGKQYLVSTWVRESTFSP